MRKSTAAVGSTVFFAAGPGLVSGLIPWLLTGWTIRDTPPYWALVRALAVAMLAAGVIVLVHSFHRFVAEGSGTPLPAAPPNRLVVGGLYRYVRNPMYVALLWMLLGQTLLFGQARLLLYTVIFWAFAATFVRWREEPVLARRFGAAYDEYRKAVRAWWPRLCPWQPNADR
jgi:protein-S-isoprenylcysteine O-methyltransferase Ste14